MTGYILRWYGPPTSNKALVIWPREQQRIASISTSNLLMCQTVDPINQHAVLFVNQVNACP